VDFRKLASKPNLDRLISPRDIFTALPARATGFGYLRDVQGQVLDAWNQRRAERDLVIKMNTGSGKTIVGLLILQSSLNEGVGPALYVAPSPYLAEQVEKQATRLGIAVVDDPESTRYSSGKAIAIVNIHKLVNGRSVFGGPGSSRPSPLPIGTVVMDDAHAALATVESQSTIVLPSTHRLYHGLLDMFRGDLSQQSESKLLDIEQGDTTAELRVPFWAWADRSSDVLKLLYTAKDDDPLKFTLPIVADLLKVSSAVFTASSLEIRPLFPPTDRIASFAAAPRRIYLTATLPDDGVLVSHFDADAESVRKPINPATAADLGDRLILSPQQINPEIEDEEIRQALRQFANRVNVVVLVPSYRRADRWVNVANVTAGAEDIKDVVEQLQTKHIGLVVLVNKYDGIDLPEAACRILVIDGLPEVYGGLDRRQALALGESEAMTGRQLQRIEQGMGRGVRSAEDHCVVILLGSRLAQLISDRRYLSKVSPATRAQMELSDAISEELRGQSLAEIVPVIQQVLDRDPAWVGMSRSRLAGIEYPEGHVDDGLLLSRSAFNAAAAGQFDKAVDLMSQAVNRTDDSRLKGWRQEEVAVYRHQIDPAGAQQVLVGAIGLNPRVTKPMLGVGYRRLSAADNQARAAADYLRATYTERNALLVGLNALLDDLAFDPDRTDEFEDAMEKLGWHLGFTSQRPERDTKNGPDVLWAIGGQRFLAIECKSGATGDVIYRHDMAQLAHSVNWFVESYGAGSTCAPLMVHPVNVLASDATPPPDCRIVTKEKLGDLRTAAKSMVTALASGDSWADPAAVGEQLKSRLLTAGDIVSRYSTTTRATKAPR
jgi:hypothetical protein